MRGSKSQWSNSPETIMSHHFRLARGVAPVVDVSPPFSMYNSPISVHYIPPRRASSADPLRKKMSKSQRELNEFVNGRTPAHLRLPLPLRSSYSDLIKPKIIESRNYQAPTHRKRQTNRPPEPAEATGKSTRKSSFLENEKNDFKDSVLTEIIARGVYSDSFIADVINEKKEKFIGRLPWEELEKSARALFRQLEVKEEAPIRLKKSSRDLKAASITSSVSTPSSSSASSTTSTPTSESFSAVSTNRSEDG